MLWHGIQSCGKNSMVLDSAIVVWYGTVFYCIVGVQRDGTV
jgi:hypothetical protein